VIVLGYKAYQEKQMKN